MTSIDSLCNIDSLMNLLKTFLLGLSISTLAAFSGILFMAFACLIAFQKKRLSAYGKGAQQLATVGLIFGWVLLIVIRVWLFHFPEKLLEYCWMGMVVAVLLQSLHFACWKILAKSHFTLHKVSVLLNACLATAAALPIIFLIRTQIQALLSTTVNAWGTLQPFLSLDIVTEHIPYFYIASMILTILVAVAAPAAWGAFLLPYFKKYQDFGRDHYRTLVSWSSLWARNAWLCVWIAQCAVNLAGTWYLWHEGKASMLDVAIIAGCQIIWLVPAVLWTMTYKSGQPLRHKLGLLVAVLLSISLF